jgi:hypothetical protein
MEWFRSSSRSLLIRAMVGLLRVSPSSLRLLLRLQQKNPIPAIVAIDTSANPATTPTTIGMAGEGGGNDDTDDDDGPPTTDAEVPADDGNDDVDDDPTVVLPTADEPPTLQSPAHAATNPGQLPNWHGSPPSQHP